MDVSGILAQLLVLLGRVPLARRLAVVIRDLMGQRGGDVSQLPDQALLDRQLRESEGRRRSVAEWWNTCHASPKERGFWLTGSSGPDVWNRLNITERIQRGSVVLNIGIGQGHCTRALAERGCIVHGLDISPVALERAKDVMASAWLPSQLDRLPAEMFDVAISHLVAQHMSDKDLSDQLRALIRSLKVTGVFDLQFGFRLHDDGEPPDESPASLKGGGVCRSLDGVRRMVETAGGTVAWSDVIGQFPEYGSGWYAVHIVRKDSAARAATPSENKGE